MQNRLSIGIQVCLGASLVFSGFRMPAQNASGDAVIFNASQTASAGDVVYLQGSGFGQSPVVQYSYNDSGWVGLSVITSGSETALVMIPTTQTRLPDLLTLRVSPDGSRWSSPAYVNRASALSFDTNQIAPASQFRIFGRNLMFSRLPTVRLVDAADGSSHPATVLPTSSKSYVLAVVAPADILPNHTYSSYVSNGYNGNGMSGSETVALKTLLGRAAGNDYWNLGVPWASDLKFSGNVYNIQTDPRLRLHSSGKGSTADLGVITAAVNTAYAAGGGIVYLPAGIYNLYFASGCGFSVPSHVVLMGAGASNTFVNFGFGAAPAAGQGGWAVCFVGSTQTGASDITFTNVNQSGQWPQSVVGLNNNEFFLQRTVWNLATAQWVVLQNNTNIAVENSSIVQGLDPSYNGPISMQNDSNFMVRGNKIKYVAGAVEFDGAIGGVVENNTFTRDASQSIPSYVVSHVIVGNFTNDFMVLNNTFNVTGGTLPTKNDGESVNSEAGGRTRHDEFRGVVNSATATSIYDGIQNFNYSTNNFIPNLHVGAILAIVGGTGSGQWATIKAISSDGHTLTVNKAWAVPPVNGSRYATFDWSSANWIIAGNILSDNEKGIEFFSASIRDILVTGNSLTNNGQILISPTEQPDGAGLFNLVLNTQILNNTLVDTNHLRPAAISAVSREDDENNNVGTAIIGLEVRGNSITGYVPATLYSDASLDDAKALTEGFNVYWQWQSSGSFFDDGTPSILGTVLQGNSLTNSLAGLETNSAVSQTVLAGNTLNAASSEIVDGEVPGEAHGSIGTKTVSPNGSSAPLVWDQLTLGSRPSSTLASQPASTTSFLLRTSEYQVGTGPDSFSMLAQKVSEDIAVVARISIPVNSNPGSEGLLVLRGNSSPASAFLAFGPNQSGQLVFQWRAYDGGGVGGYTFPCTLGPIWVKLTKAGSTFDAFFSSNGSSWSYGGTINLDFFGDYFVGLESLSSTLTSPPILFDNVSVP